MQSIEYFSCARSILSKLDIWIPSYLGAEYWILCMCKKYLLEVGYMDPQEFWRKVLSTLHVQEVFFEVRYMGPRYLGAKYWILCTCIKNFYEVWYMDPQVFRCRELITLHMPEVFFRIWIYWPPDIYVQIIEYLARARSIFWSWI